MRCRTASMYLPRAPEDELPARVRKHSAECLRCQAEAARYRGLVRDLHGLGGVVERAPRKLAAAVLETMDAEAPEPGRSRVWAAAGAAAAGGAALAGAFVVRRLQRKGLGVAA